MKWTSELNVFGIFRRRKYVPIMDGGKIVAGVFVTDPEGNKVANYQAIVAMVTAAPDMMKALEDCDSDVARAALAKARGEA